MDYKELAEKAKVCCGDIKVEDCAERCKNPFDKRGEEVRWCRQWLIHDLHTAITDLLARAEEAEDRCKRLEEARENANEAAAKWESMYHMALERTEKAERERDAAVKDLRSAVIGTIHACDYCIKSDPENFRCDYTELTGCHEWEWRGQKDE